LRGAAPPCIGSGAAASATRNPAIAGSENSAPDGGYRARLGFWGRGSEAEALGFGALGLWGVERTGPWVFEFSGDLVTSFGKAYCKAKAEMVVKGCCSAIRKRSGGSGHGERARKTRPPAREPSREGLHLRWGYQRIALLSWLMRTADHREVCGSSLCGATFGDRLVNIQVSHTHTHTSSEVSGLAEIA
jgi:hypothetical protein